MQDSFLIPYSLDLSGTETILLYSANPLVMCSFVDVLKSNELFQWLISKVLASHRGDPCSISDRCMSNLGPSIRNENFLVK
jgi:hypothetical protein